MYYGVGNASATNFAADIHKDLGGQNPNQLQPRTDHASASPSEPASATSGKQAPRQAKNANGLNLSHPQTLNQSLQQPQDQPREERAIYERAIEQAKA